MKPHRLTPVQRDVLEFMFLVQEPVVFETGHKRTAYIGRCVIQCQTLVPYFLKHHGYIHKPNEASVRWELTDKGHVAIGCAP